MQYIVLTLTIVLLTSCSVFVWVLNFQRADELVRMLFDDRYKPTPFRNHVNRAYYWAKVAGVIVLTVGMVFFLAFGISR